jgi:hypothetical protein
MLAARADVGSGLRRSTGQWQLNNFRLLEIGAKTGAITATERKLIAKRKDTFQFAPGFSQTHPCQQTTLRKQEERCRKAVCVARISMSRNTGATVAKPLGAIQ